MSTPPSGPPPVPNPNPAPKGDDGPVLDDESLKRWKQFGGRLGAL